MKMYRLQEEVGRVINKIQKETRNFFYWARKKPDKRNKGMWPKGCELVYSGAAEVPTSNCEVNLTYARKSKTVALNFAHAY
jgi:hypothetical protein